MKKIAMIGLDGMAWPILNKLFEWKVMPHLEEITQKSLRGILKSTIPPSSPPAWTSIATGVNPGKHGIFGFTKPEKDYENTKITSSRDVKYLRIHEMVAVQGLRSICVNQILTHPIRKIPGSLVITDWLSPEIEFSPEIEQYAKNYLGPTLGKSSPMSNMDWDTEYTHVSSRVDTINTLLEEINWDLFWVIYSEPDHIFHKHYDLVMKKKEKVMGLFSKIDETFDLIADICDLLIVVSDHGFNKYTHGVYTNTFLEELGLAKRAAQQSLKDLASQRNVDKQRTGFLLTGKVYKYLSVMPSPLEFIFLKIYKRLTKAGIKVQMTTYVDPKSSKAFAHEYGIYVNEEEVIDYIITMLKNSYFIGGIWRKEEIYHGKQLENMPDLIVIPNFDRGYAFRGSVIAPKPVVRRDFSDHHPDGIAIVYKDGVRPSWSKGIKIYDIVPTILDFLDLDIPEDTDGNVIDL